MFKTAESKGIEDRDQPMNREVSGWFGLPQSHLLLLFNQYVVADSLRLCAV